MNYQLSPFKTGKAQWRFPSCADFLAIMPFIFRRDRAGMASVGIGGRFYSPSKIAEACNEARAGSAHLVPRAMQLMEKFSIAIAQRLPTEIRSVCGYRTCIPSFLNGEIDCMRTKQRKRNPNNNVPLRIFHSVVAFGEDRGLCTLALAMEMAKTRPVELYTYNHGISDADGNFFTVAIKAEMPFCLSEVCHMLTSTTFKHTLTYGLEQSEMGQLGYTPESCIREALGAADNDLVLHGSDFDCGETVDSAIAWAKGLIEKHNQSE